MNRTDDIQLEAVGWFLNRIDADIACGAMLGAGIPAVVAADDAGGIRPNLWLSGVRLLVPSDDVERAKEILREAENAPTSE